MTHPAWPDYLKKETLAKRLNLAPGAIDQLVQRGILPAPVQVGDAKLWRWEDVDNRLRGGQAEEAAVSDPYLVGLERAQQTPPSRSHLPKQGRA